MHVDITPLMHGDIADIQFFFKWAVEAKYCLMAVNFFTSNTYNYPMKSRYLLVQKIKPFSQDIQPKMQQVAKNERIRLEFGISKT